MNDILFYWSAWICWIWATWVMDKSKNQARIATFSLVAIICSNYAFSIVGYTVNVAVIFFLLLSVSFVIKKQLAKQIYYIFIGVETALGYAAIHLLTIFDPVLFILPLNIMTTIFLLIITGIFASQINDKLFIIFFSATVGEIIIGMIFGKLHLHHEIGMSGYLTRMALPFMIIALLSTLKTMGMKNKFV
mgnify:CR=1 FL=1